MSAQVTFSHTFRFPVYFPIRSLSFGAVVLASSLVLVTACGPNGPPSGDARHTLAEEPVDEPDAIDSLSHISWEWEAPVWTDITDVSSVAPGPAVFLRDGVIVLDGNTGEEVWSYIAPEDRSFYGFLNHDRSAFIVALGESSESNQEVFLLDVFTGADIGTIEIPEEPFATGLDKVNLSFRATRDERVEESQQTYSVRDLDTGEIQWEQEEILSCADAPDMDSVQDDAVIHTSVLIIAVTCSPEVYKEGMEVFHSVTALDLSDGSEVWRQNIVEIETSISPDAKLDVMGDEVVLHSHGMNTAHVIDVQEGDIVEEIAEPVVAVFEEGLLVDDSGAGHLTRSNVDGPTEYYALLAGEGTKKSLVLPDDSWDVTTPQEVSLFPDGLASVEAKKKEEGGELTLRFTAWDGTSSVLDAGSSSTLTDFTDEMRFGMVTRVPGGAALVNQNTGGSDVVVAYH